MTMNAHFTIQGGRYDGLGLSLPLPPGGQVENGTPVYLKTAFLEEISGNFGAELPPVAVFFKDHESLIPGGFQDDSGQKLPDPTKN
jgi:hypothetical protein